MDKKKLKLHTLSLDEKTELWNGSLSKLLPEYELVFCQAPKAKIALVKGSKKIILYYLNQIRRKAMNLPIIVLAPQLSEFLILHIHGFGLIRTVSSIEEIPSVVDLFLNPQKAPQIAVIMPVYNEEKRLKNVYHFAQQINLLRQKAFSTLRIYYVNDGSDDHTQELLSKFIEEKNTQEQAYFHLVQLNENTHKAGVLIWALQNLDEDFFLFVDADDSFFIFDIARMISLAEQGPYDIISGTKDHTSQGRHFLRILMSASKRLLTKSLLPQNTHDSQTGLKIMNRHLAKKIIPFLHQNSELAIDLEVLYLVKKFGFKALEIPVRCLDREGSHIRILRDSLFFLKNLIKIPLQFELTKVFSEKRKNIITQKYDDK